MADSRKRWGSGAALLILAAGVGWVIANRTAVVERSRAIRIGMARNEVEEVMSETAVTRSVGDTELLFGAGSIFKLRVAGNRWLGTSSPDMWAEDFPVIVRLGLHERVWRIERGSEIEEYEAARWLPPLEEHEYRRFRPQVYFR